MRFINIFIIYMYFNFVISRDLLSSELKDMGNDDDDDESDESDESDEYLDMTAMEEKFENLFKSKKLKYIPKTKNSSKINEIEGYDKLKDMTICDGFHSTKGTCMDLEKCLKLLKKNLKKTNFKVSKKFCKPKYLKKVCCPISHTNRLRTAKITRSKVNTILPPIETCGVAKRKRSFQKVVGGKDSEIGAWPWMALLGYDILTIVFMCGGTLVTKRHVITAAHCINLELVVVRLGEHDLSTDTEAKHIDFNITKIVQTDFNETTGRNDLAILVLEKTVVFTDSILPICLPIYKNLLVKSYVGSQPFVAGWGYTKENGTAADVLQELQTKVLRNSVCYTSFEANSDLKAKNQFDESVLCVGDTVGGKDTCLGDSGGPLMMPESINGTMRFFLVGVVSQGIGCARKGLAGVYTNVPYYMKWIKAHLK